VLPAHDALGGEIEVVIEGVGRSETANTCTVLLNNGYLGYGCGFNSQGDVTSFLRVPGQAGVHFLSFYPSIYQGEVTGPGAPATPDANATYLLVPMLHEADHPGEVLPDRPGRQYRSVSAMRWCPSSAPSSANTTSPCLASTSSMTSSTASASTFGPRTPSSTRYSCPASASFRAGWW
jgi:hypothetical protein